MPRAISNALFTVSRPIANASHDDHFAEEYDLASRGHYRQRPLPFLEGARKVLGCHQSKIAHFACPDAGLLLRRATGYEVKIAKGYNEFQLIACISLANEPMLNFRDSLNDNSNMAKNLIGGFGECLYPVRKLQSDSERRIALI
jgi:type III restriction enzyme